MRQFIFAGTCIHENEKDINQMKENAKEITHRTFVKYVDQKQATDALDFELGVQYGKSIGLALKDDLHVSYHKSTFKRKQCYYMTHSDIEFIFLNENEI
jgi:hypothetical protein